MCQVSAYVQEGDKETLFLENITTMKCKEAGFQIASLFDGERQLSDLILDKIDFTAGKVIFRKKA